MVEKYSFKNLIWDTEYFGIKSARLDLLSEMTEVEFLEALDLTDGYEFICIANLDCCVENARLIAKHTNAFVADTNVQFVKKYPFSMGMYCQQLSSCICASDFKISNKYAYDPSIVGMTEQIYMASRFIADSRLLVRNGRAVYTEWVKNAFSKVDKYFITHKNASGITDAYLLYSRNGDAATVELVGVSPATQHQGLGKMMWYSLELQLASNNITQIHVGTQIANTGAIGLYSSVGCRLIGCNQVYHWWKCNY